MSGIRCRIHRVEGVRVFGYWVLDFGFWILGLRLRVYIRISSLVFSV